jgi:hypothetical protein
MTNYESNQSISRTIKTGGSYQGSDRYLGERTGKNFRRECRCNQSNAWKKNHECQRSCQNRRGSKGPLGQSKRKQSRQTGRRAETENERRCQGEDRRRSQSPLGQSQSSRTETPLIPATISILINGPRFRGPFFLFLPSCPGEKVVHALQSGGGQPHSRTLARAVEQRSFRQVLDCASPLALSKG